MKKLFNKKAFALLLCLVLALTALLTVTAFADTAPADGTAAQTYANIIAVRKGDENSPKIQALIKALESASVKAYIEKQYGGAVQPMFSVN